MNYVRSLLAFAVALVLTLALGFAAGCAVVPQSDGTTKTVLVECDATSPAKSIACAAATLKAAAATADRALLEGRLSVAQVERLQLDFQTAYAYIVNAETAARYAAGTEIGYLTMADKILQAIEKELQ